MIYFKNRIKAFKYALQGISHFFTSEVHAKMHLAASITVIILGFYFKITNSDWLWIALAITLVLMAEILNSCIERIVDLHSTENSILAKQAKDLGAAAVLLTAIFSVVVAVLIIQPYL